MARPRLDTPNYRLTRRGTCFYIRWWTNGQWRRVSTRTADRREAEKILAQFIAGLSIPAPVAAPTVSAILDGYLVDRKPHVSSYATLTYACAALNRHLGDLEPSHLTEQRSRVYAQQRRAEGYFVGPKDAKRKKPVSDATITREIVTLRSAPAMGHPAKVARRRSAAYRSSCHSTSSEMAYAQRAGALLSACIEPHARLFVALALYTAARTGAILEMTWPRVDFESRTLDVGTGTGNKRRAEILPIADALMPYLLDARRGATGPAVIEFGGKPVASIKTGFRAACVRAGLADVTPHTLRHTAATWMAIAGRPMAEIARYLGNSEEIVERVYAKHSPSYLRAAAAALSGPVAPLTPVDKVG